MQPTLKPRPATPTDHETFLRLFVELATGDPLPVLDRWVAAMMPTTLLYEDEGGAVAGYTFHQVLTGTVYVAHVVTAPGFRGRGVGRGMMEHLASVGRAAGCTDWCLNVKPDNAPAIRLYEGVGMKRAYASTSIHLLWSSVPDLPAPSRPVESRVVDPAEDPALEAAFDLPTGRITSGRKYPGRVILRLVDPGAPAEARVGVASFDPHFPGAFPFRVAEPSFARAMLEAMRPHALPEHDHVSVMVEDHAELTRALLDHGATVKLEVLHYRGKLA